MVFFVACRRATESFSLTISVGTVSLRLCDFTRRAELPDTRTQRAAVPDSLRITCAAPLHLCMTLLQTLPTPPPRLCPTSPSPPPPPPGTHNLGPRLLSPFFVRFFLPDIYLYSLRRSRVLLHWASPSPSPSPTTPHPPPPPIFSGLSRGREAATHPTLDCISARLLYRRSDKTVCLLAMARHTISPPSVPATARHSFFSSACQQGGTRGAGEVRNRGKTGGSGGIRILG